MSIIKQIQISEVKVLLKAGKKLKVRTKDGEFVPIIDYFEKGILPTFRIELDNGYSIKTSSKHKFFTSQGWMTTDELKPTLTKIYCDDNLYHTVNTVEYIGKFPIVDIKVDSDEHSYFGNGFLNHNSGKSLLSAHLLKSTQQAGGVAVMIDTENAVSFEFLEAIGVDISKMIYVQADSVEAVFEMMEILINKVREQSRDVTMTIVVDSVAAASTKIELAADYDQAGYATQKAIIISKAMRKITNMIGRQKILVSFTNQLRVNMNAMAFADPYTTSGGKALQFHASVRLRLKPKGQIKQGERIVGIKVQCVVVKNRLGPPKRSMEFDIFFDRGVDNYGSWLKVLKDAKIIKQSGAWYTVVDTETGEEHKFQSKEFQTLLESNVGLKQQLYTTLCKDLVMEYEVDTSDPDTLTVESADTE